MVASGDETARAATGQLAQVTGQLGTRRVRWWSERWWAVSAGFAARTPREEERGKDDRGFKEVIELSGKGLKTRVI
jgi:hypothetical protein